jgi:modulator of FtsH protease
VEAFDAALAAWQAFFSAQLSAGATLLGLVFVGLSLNLTRFLADPLLPVRAEIALIVLVLQLVVASITLVPDQPRGAAASEILAVGGMAWLATTAMNRRLVRHAAAPGSRRLARQSMLLLQLATLPYLVDAWVLLVEINR